MKDGHFLVFNLQERLTGNEEVVMTMVKTSENGIEVRTKWIGNVGRSKKKDTSNNFVSKNDVLNGNVKGNNFFHL